MVDDEGFACPVGCLFGEAESTVAYNTPYDEKGKRKDVKPNKLMGFAAVFENEQG